MSDRFSKSGLDPLMREGIDWIVRIRSGRFSPSDQEALKHWRAQNKDHDAAFRRAELLGDKLVEVGRQFREQNSSIIEPEQATAAVSQFSQRGSTRRMVLTGGVAASIAGVAFLSMSSYGLLDGPAADFATGRGERRRVQVAQGLSLDLDAATRVAIDRGTENIGITLLDGRAEVTANMAVVVTVGKGKASARNARFNVERNGEEACITCLAGQVELRHPLRQVILTVGQRVRYTDDRMDAPLAVSAAESDAWKHGWLVFHGAPLEQVVREVNRYRQGRIVVANGSLAARPVNAVFHVDRIDMAIGQIRQLTGARGTELPGGMIILT